MTETSKRKMTHEQKEKIASWIKEQKKDAGIDKHRIVEGTDIEFKTLNNYLSGVTEPRDEKIRLFVKRTDELKVCNSGFEFCELYHRLNDSEFLDLVKKHKAIYGTLENQDELMELLGVSQTQASNIMSGKVSLSVEDQLKILHYLCEHEPSNHSELRNEIQQDIVRSNLYILSDLALRDYRYLPVEQQQKLERIMIGYLKVFAYNYDRRLDRNHVRKHSKNPYCFEYMMENFTEEYDDNKYKKILDIITLYSESGNYGLTELSDKELHYFERLRESITREDNKNKCKRISDTIRLYSNPGHYSLIGLNDEYKDLLRNVIEPKLRELKVTKDRNDYEKIELLKYALCALAKQDIKSDLNTTLTQAIIISAIEDPSCLAVGTENAELFEALDRFENALPFSLICRCARIDDPTNIDAYYSYFNNEFICTSEYYRRLDEFNDFGFSDEEIEMANEDYVEQQLLDNEIEYFYEHLGPEAKRLLFDNLPCFINLDSGLEFDSLTECFERFSKLDGKQLEHAVELLNSYPQVSPYFYNDTAENREEFLLTMVDDPFSEITYCRKMMWYHFDPNSSKNRDLTAKSKIDNKNLQLLRKIIDLFYDGTGYVITNIAEQIKLKLEFTPHDWYLWQLMLNVFHTKGIRELYTILSQIENETNQ